MDLVSTIFVIYLLFLLLIGFFTYKFSKELQRDFDEQNKFQTSIRGVKVRGVFDTREAAAARAKKLSTLDSNFHVFVGQVGYPGIHVQMVFKMKFSKIVN